MILDENASTFKNGDIVYYVGGYYDVDDTYDFLDDDTVDSETIEYTIKHFSLKTYKIYRVTDNGFIFGKEYEEKTKKLVKDENGKGFKRKSLPKHKIFKTKSSRSEYLANWFIELYGGDKNIENFNFDRDIIFEYEHEITSPFYNIILDKIPESLI